MVIAPQAIVDPPLLAWTMKQSYPTDTNFVLLDGLRGLGALLVLVGHTMVAWGPFSPQSGSIVVDAFFALSGFVLAYAYEPRFKMGMRAGEFMLHRIVRLFPLYLLGTVAVYLVLLAMTFGDADGAERAGNLTVHLIPQLFMLPAPASLGSAEVYSLNWPAYTLMWELVANLVYVLIFRWLTTRVLIGVVIVSGLFLAFAILHFGSIDLGPDWPTWWGGLPRAMFGFFLGVLAFRLVGAPQTARRPKSWLAIPLLLSLPVFCCIPASYEMRPFVDIALAWVALLPMLILCQSIRPPDRFTHLFMVGGRISYAVYILHQPVRDIIKRVQWNSTIVTDYAPWTGLAILVGMVGVAYVAEKYYDRPVRRAFVKMLRTRAAKRRSNAGFAE